MNVFIPRSAGSDPATNRDCRAQRQHRAEARTLRARRIERLALVSLIMACSRLASPAASTNVWNLDNNGNWNVAGNWTGGGFPNAIDSKATFGNKITANRTITLGANLTLGTLVFDNANNYTIAAGNTLTFDVSSGSAALTVNNTAGNGAHTINAAMTLRDGINVQNNSTGLLTLGGAIGQAVAAQSLTLSGTGNVQLSGAAANTYAGTTTVNGGNLLLNKTAGLNAIAGALVIGDGAGSDGVGLLADNQIANASAVTVNNSGIFDLNGRTETIGALTVNGGAVQATTGVGNLTITTLTMTGGSITTGTGTLTLGGNVTGNASASTATINGTVALGGNRTFTIANGAAATDFSVTGAMTGANTLTLAGPGTVQFNGTTANTYSGATTVNAGNLLLNKTAGVNAIAGALVIGDGAGSDGVGLLADNQIANASAVTVNSSGVFDLNGHTETVGALVVNGGLVQATTGAGNLTITTLGMTGGSINTGTGTLTLGGNVTGNASANTATINGATLALGGNRTFTVAKGTAVIDMNLATAITGANTLTLAGAGTVQYSGTTANTYSGTTTVNAGTLQLNKTAGLNALAGALVIGDGTFTDTVTLLADNQIANASAVTVNGSGVFDLNGHSETFGALTVNGGSVLATTGVGNLTVTTLAMTGGSIGTGTGTLTLGGNVTGNASANSAIISGRLSLGGNRTFTIANGAAANDMDISAVIVGANNFIKAGAGTMSLSGASANTYSGTTTVSAGVLAANKSGALGATTGIILSVTGTLSLGANNPATSTPTLTLSGGTLQGNSYNATFGAFNLTANSAITLDTVGGVSSLTFATGTRTAGTLTINNWAGFASGSSDDKVIFNANPGGTFLANVLFTGHAPGALWLASDHEIVPSDAPVPEVKTIFSAALLLGFAGWRSARKFVRRTARG